MRLIASLIIVFIVLCSCNRKSGSDPWPEQPYSQEKNEDTSSYFPVSTVILGGIREIKDLHVNPLMYTEVGGKLDSAWVKAEDIDKVFTEFTTPLLDTADLKKYFTESKFEDQTLGTYTFMYEPKPELPDSLLWKSWVAYVDIEKGKTRRIDLIKKGDKETQVKYLSWNPQEGTAQVRVLDNISNANSDPAAVKKVERSTLIKWKL